MSYYFLFSHLFKSKYNLIETETERQIYLKDNQDQPNFFQ